MMGINCEICGRSFGSDEALKQHLRDSPAHAPSFICKDCDRSFGSNEALEQHLRDSPVHAPVFECEECDRSFGSDEALKQHLRDSPAHAPSFACEDCDRSFGSNEALEQHLRDSPAHAPLFECKECDRSFGSDEALKQHLRDSPAHAPSFECESCDRSFSSNEALEQHLRDSPAHAPLFECEKCDRSFCSDEALKQHLRDSAAHRQIPGTPLDSFFGSFPTFHYDPSLPPATSFAQLQEHEGWQRGDAVAKKAWDGYQEALESELRMWFGEEDGLTAWHTLCRAIGIKLIPQTIKQCEKAVRNTHVNIVDLIEWGRKGENTGSRVQTFQTVDQLRDYSRETGKIFRNRFDQEDGNVVIRHLLRKILRPDR